ncbi:LAMI_0H15720g1_1 [Lachancea mirantina]|uniref:LAMI_0H15720g1_1 n=1 Tax=Lachancea mirantina TaxID=1230905 RepID=A0A1G4KIJ2_9SACH|nr:LAMI_0H15720g1_1 [Lachancea mirantina]
MFKKEPHIKALSNLKNSERKKLLTTCKEQVEQGDYAFPSQIVKQTTFKTPFTTGIVYTDDQNTPIWFKEKFSELLYPTVYTCWENPNLLPIVLAHEYVVEEKLLQGANLMLPGTVPPFDACCKKTALVGVASTKYPRTVKAIGIVQLDLPSFERVVGQTGVAVEIVHHFDDQLCKGMKIKLQPPDLGEMADVSTESEDEEDFVENKNEKGAENFKHGAEPKEPIAAFEDVSEQLEQLSVNEVDHFITRSLYYTLTQEPAVDLPISASNFVSNHILRNLPPVDHSQVNIKKSSWKKSSKFLKHFEKEGFLKLKGKGDDITVVGATKDKTELKSFVPYRRGDPASDKGTTTTSKSDKTTMLAAHSLYKPLSNAKDFVKVTDLPPNHLFSKQDVKAAVDNYITAKKLVNPENKATIILDDLLFSMVNRATKKENAKRIVPRAQIMEPLLAHNFGEHFVVVRPDGSSLFKNSLRGSIPQIKIVTEMKIGRKVVTKVSNFDKFDIDASELASELRKKCSGSTTIGETVSSPKTPEVTVQGPHGPTAIEILNEHGIPTKWIDFTNKIKPKKKRQH